MGRLYVVGTGIGLAGQLTIEARNVVRHADQAFALMAEPLALEFLRALSPRLISLSAYYGGGRTRDQSYAEMVDRILQPLEDGQTIAAVFYGHPGVFVWPSHEAIRRARAAGYSATMLPGISAEDCLIADLGLDPGVSGLQTYEACDFLVYPRRFDPCVPLVLWQLAALGDVSRNRFEADPIWLNALANVLMQEYPADHSVTVYEAASFPLDEPRIERLPLSRLGCAAVTQASTLYIPPTAAPAIDYKRLEALGLPTDVLVEASFQRARRKSYTDRDGLGTEHAKPG